MTRPNKKRNDAARNISSIWIEPFKQIKFGVYMIGTSLIFILVSGLLFWHAFDAQYQQLIAIFNIIDPKDLWELKINDVFQTNALRILIFFISFFIINFFIVFLLTHRYYGPLVSIERFVGEITEGKLTSRVNIRSKDELQNLAKKLNKMAESLEKRQNSNQD